MQYFANLFVVAEVDMAAEAGYSMFVVEFLEAVIFVNVC
jgi:hypothetical protein